MKNTSGEDVNGLSLESLCVQIASEMDIIESRMKPKICKWFERIANRVLWPLKQSVWYIWIQQPESRLDEAFNAKVQLALETTKNSSSGLSSKSGVFHWLSEFRPG
ncbi:hypothetical protein K432DRAFT_410808 [Lepidopterella palustris CBS 459.81]|uniref:Uncharacterized protein n=1 Tax=Lepidopterella palustris CBS 459.81 TaxID=1314670 RepID=A0A8E2J8K3_9PEZI|nr:hypothetical protein K432DRAFT_410808 [Lepidopterella palustris CBS 459.81]